MMCEECEEKEGEYSSPDSIRFYATLCEECFLRGVQTRWRHTIQKIQRNRAEKRKRLDMKDQLKLW